MTAAALARTLSVEHYDVYLVESEEIGTIGVGEATIPHIRFFNQMLGIKEADFMKQTQATYKLGIEFVNWGAKGQSYLHPFGDFGEDIDGVSFHHYWRKMALQEDVGQLQDYSLPIQAAVNRKFAHPSQDRDKLSSQFGYAYHLDATAYARFLRQYAETKQVKRIEGRIQRALLASSGDIESVVLADGRCVEADFFIDCSGFKGLLIEQALHAGYEHWDQWFICNSALAVASDKFACGSQTAKPVTPPYTRAIAHSHGWQWQIPLQHRMGNGLVYSSEHLPLDQAQECLLKNLPAETENDIRHLRFKPGIRKQLWRKNCVSIGLSAGFMEPLESTGLYLIQSGIMHLLECLPSAGMNMSMLSTEYNRIMKNEFERVRDFLILHYLATERTDSDFWIHAREVPVPDTLSQRIALFRATGEVDFYKKGLFQEASWLAVMYGQGIEPRSYHPMVRNMDSFQLLRFMQNRRQQIAQAVASMPDHDDTLVKTGMATLY